MSQSPYAAVGPRLVQLGYSAIPIMPGSKAPGRFDRDWQAAKGWSRFCYSLPSEEEVALWCRWPDAGVGICLGPASDLTVVDFDNHPELWPAIEALIPPSPVRKRGEKGYSAFYRFTGQRKRQLVASPGDRSPVVEILSLGQQTLVPPTVHPNTKVPYVWDGPSLLDVARSDLPVLPDNLYDLMRVAIGAPVEHYEPIRRPSDVYDTPSLAMIEAMLKVMNPSCSRVRWRDTGMSIKSMYPGDDGFRLWNEWSAGAPDKYNEREMSGQWRSFKPDGPIGPGTIIHFAKQEGFDDLWFDVNRGLEGVSGELIPKKKPLTTIIDLPAQPERPKFTIPEELVMSAPGLVGDITRWIVESSIQPQPVLALAAALAAVGALKGHRVRTETNLRTNIYVLGLAESGSGKRYPIDAVRVLFREAGCDAILGKEPGSEPGLCEMLREGNGVSLLLWDEIGHAISAMCDKNNGSHYTTIMATITNLFTEASSFHEGKALAAGSRSNIEQPCLCICGMTVEERLFENLTKENASDGFLPRWMIFEVTTNNPKQQRMSGAHMPPAALVEKVLAVHNWPKHYRENEERRLASGKRPLPNDIYDPKWVPYTDEAREAYWQCREEFAARAEIAAAQGRGARAIWNRAAEHIARVALIVSGYEQTGMKEFNWARDLVVSRCEALCDAVSRRIGQNDKERNTKKVYELIRECDTGIPKNLLTRKTQWLTSQERSGIITTLIDSEQIRVVEQKRKAESSDDSAPVGRPGIVYRAIE